MSNKQLRIAISGKQRVGKDTLAEYLCNITYSETERFSFAKAIYDIAGFIQKRLSKPVEKDRLLLRTLGEFLKNLYGRDVWIKCVLGEIERCKDNIIVTDVRFKEEFNSLKELGFVMIRIKRNNNEEDNHISETDLDDYEKKFDFIIENNGSLYDLKKEAYNFYSKLSFN